MDSFGDCTQPQISLGIRSLGFHFWVVKQIILPVFAILSRPAVVPRVCTLDVPAPAEKRRRVEEVPQTWHQVVMSSDAATWREANDAKMDTALKRWFDVVILFPTSFQLVAQLAEMPTVGEQMRMMRDVLGSKSPLTLLKRVNSIILYSVYLISAAEGGNSSRL